MVFCVHGISCSWYFGLMVFRIHGILCSWHFVLMVFCADDISLTRKLLSRCILALRKPTNLNRIEQLQAGLYVRPSDIYWILCSCLDQNDAFRTEMELGSLLLCEVKCCGKKDPF